MKSTAFNVVLLLVFSTIANSQGRRYADSLLTRLQQLPADTNHINTCNKLAIYYAGIRSDSALVFIQKSIALAEQLAFARGKAEALGLACKYYRVNGDFTRALKLGLERVQVNKEIPATGEAATSNLDIAQVYKDMIGRNNNEEYIHTGIAYANEGYALFASVKDTAGMVLSLNMKGILYRDKAKNAGKEHYYDTAMNMYQKAFRFVEQSGQGEVYMGKLYNNISQVYTEYKADYPNALRYLDKAIAFNLKHNNVSSLSYNYGNVSTAYARLQQPAASLKYAKLMFEAALLEGAPSRIQNAGQALYRSYHAMGNSDSALKYYILADNINDSLTNVVKTKQVMDLQLQYETAQKEDEIVQLNAAGKSQAKRIVGLVLLLCVIVITAVAMLWMYHSVKRQKELISEQAAKLEMVMKELHHRVKNNLQIVSSLLSLQSYKLNDEETIGVLRESQQRVQAMSLIHQRLYAKDELTTINMKEYITDLVETLLSAYGYNADAFRLNLAIDTEYLDVDKALPLGLLINEIVTNAMKYAYNDNNEPALDISLNDKGEHLTLIVYDNGSGLDVDAWKKKGTSFGKQLISILGKQLRAQQQVAVDNGTRFTITIPYKAA